MSWMASVSGASVELTHPTATEVNFREMAHALAHLNRYSGQTTCAVSVAQHLIIGCDICPEPLKPWWLLHDGHEERLGDTTTPAKDAFKETAAELFGPDAATLIDHVRRELEHRHDLVIHQAAGLPLPTKAQKIDIKRIDWVALATERRDFHAVQQRPWWIDTYKIQPHRKVYRPLSAAKAADQLFALFSRYLPALAGATGRAA